MILYPHLERISIELTNLCAKACSFCYNHSDPTGALAWPADDLIAFVQDCANNGVKAVSFGGGEPLQYPDLYKVLDALSGKIFRSMTTNGLLLQEHLDRVAAARPDKVHISIHYPQDRDEVERVTQQVIALQDRGIKSGVNLLVGKSWLQDAAQAARHLHDHGIDNSRIVYLPMRIYDTPSPDEVASVAGGSRFQSTTCLSACGISRRFCSISADRTVGWCSYTTSRSKLQGLCHADLMHALHDLDLVFCGGKSLEYA